MTIQYMITINQACLGSPSLCYVNKLAGFPLARLVSQRHLLSFLYYLFLIQNKLVLNKGTENIIHEFDIFNDYVLPMNLFIDTL